jgi:hypothetical protein
MTVTTPRLPFPPRCSYETRRGGRRAEAMRGVSSYLGRSASSHHDLRPADSRPRHLGPRGTTRARAHRFVGTGRRGAEASRRARRRFVAGFGRKGHPSGQTVRGLRTSTAHAVARQRLRLRCLLGVSDHSGGEGGRTTRRPSREGTQARLAQSARGGFTEPVASSGTDEIFESEGQLVSCSCASRDRT